MGRVQTVVSTTVTLLHLDLDMVSRDVDDVIWVVHSWLFSASSLSLEDSGLDWLVMMSRIACARWSFLPA